MSNEGGLWMPGFLAPIKSSGLGILGTWINVDKASVGILASELELVRKEARTPVRIEGTSRREIRPFCVLEINVAKFEHDRITSERNECIKLRIPIYIFDFELLRK